MKMISGEVGSQKGECNMLFIFAFSIFPCSRSLLFFHTFLVMYCEKSLIVLNSYIKKHALCHLHWTTVMSLYQGFIFY